MKYRKQHGMVARCFAVPQFIFELYHIAWINCLRFFWPIVAIICCCHLGEIKWCIKIEADLCFQRKIIKWMSPPNYLGAVYVLLDQPPIQSHIILQLHRAVTKPTLAVVFSYGCQCSVFDRTVRRYFGDESVLSGSPRNRRRRRR